MGRPGGITPNFRLEKPTVNSMKQVAVVGLGKIEWRYDFTDGVFQETAKSHFGAVMAIPELKLKYGVDLDVSKSQEISKVSNINLLGFDSFVSQEYSYDLLILATPTNKHLEVLQELIKIHRFDSVILEKPCGDCLEDCKVILDLLEENSKKWQVNYFRSVLPHTLRALKRVRDLNLKSTKASIIGYGDFQNIFSHFIHLLLLFIEEDYHVIDACSVEHDRAKMRFSNGFEIDFHNINGPKQNLPILSILMDNHKLIFRDNGQVIELSNPSGSEVQEIFKLETFDRYQHLATLEYLERFHRGASANRLSVEMVHKIANALHL